MADSNQQPPPPSPLVHAIAGSLGSAVALCLLYPLERVRIEQQLAAAGTSADSDNDGHKCEEVRSSDSANEGLVRCLVRLYRSNQLFTGISSVVTTLSASNFVFFLAFQRLKRLFRRSDWKRSLAASTLAGIINVLLTNPLWVANLNIIANPSSSSSLWSELVRIYKQRGGLVKLWSGTTASLFLVSNPIIQFFLYEQVKDNRAVLSPTQAFLAGATAKAIATIVTYPLQLAQSLLRHNHKYTGTCDCLQDLMERQGIVGLYCGIQAKLLQTVLTAAFTFLSYEQILRVVHRVAVKRKR